MHLGLCAFGGNAPERVEGFLDERSMHRSQPFHATSLSTWNLDFPRRLAKSSNRTTSRHAKHVGKLNHAITLGTFNEVESGLMVKVLGA